MNKFEQYLIDNGIHFQTAGNYGRVADKFLEWCKIHKHNVARMKRSQITDWLQLCREQGNKKRTIIAKQIVLKHFYNFLGTKNNPAVSWIKSKKEHTLPPPAIEKSELQRIYESFKPCSPAEYRNRCMMGLVLFQGLKRSELEELRISDVNFETGFVFVQGQRKTNSRHLKFEPFQMLHLYEYFNKFRNAILTHQQSDTDNFFISYGNGKGLNNAVTIMLKKLKMEFPQVENLLHIRGSVITNWQNDEGIMEAMVKAGHRYVSSTQRYQTNKYEELQDQLKSIHPLEQMDI